MGTLYVVATPIGNLNDMTPRAIETLRNVDLIAVEDTRQTIKLLKVFDIKTKMITYHKFNEKSRTDEIITKLVSGLNIALVSDAGTPCISDPGYLLIKSVREKGINVLGIPGSSSLVTALSIAGIPTNTFCFYGFLPTDSSKFKKTISEIENSVVLTFVFYESPRRIIRLVEKLKIYFPESLITICSDMTKKFERSFYGPIETVYNLIKEDNNIEKGEYVIVLHKETKKVETPTEALSIEARIVDLMIKNQCTLKEAIQILKDIDKALKKQDIYNASLRLKGVLDN